MANSQPEEVVDISSSEEDDDHRNVTFAEMMTKAGMEEPVDSAEITLDKKAQYLKETGNFHFSEFKKREHLMTHERKRTVLNWAIQCYETAYTMCEEALKDKARVDADTAEIVILPREDVVDLMKSLTKNAAVMYMYLARVETVPGTKLHCFNKSAEVSR